MEINNIVFDSRKVEKGTVFVAQKGASVDGHLFINKAIELGAIAVICEDLLEDKKQGVTYVQVPCVNSALAIMAANFYNNPSKKIPFVPVTPTKGIFLDGLL